MAVEADIINKIRRKVFDYSAPQVYDDTWYQDALDFAFSRLNFDLNTSYDMSSLPARYEWAIVLLGAIEMCGIRALENYTTADSETATVGNVRRVEVDGLETEFFDGGAINWGSHCQKMWDMYLSGIEDNTEDTATTTVGVATAVREDLRNNRGWKNPTMDSGIDASTLLPAISNTSDGVLITWENIYSTQFASYVVERKLSSGDWYETDDVTKLTTITNHRTARFIDTNSLDLDAGDYTYRVGIKNRNRIVNYSEDLDITLS